MRAGELDRLITIEQEINIETGTAQTSEAYLLLDGTSGNYASTPDSAANSVTGDLDVRFIGAADDWTPASIKALVTKNGVAPNASWSFLISTNGIPQLVLSTDGTASTIYNSTAGPATAFADGSVYGLRVTIDVDNGAGGHTVAFYESDATGAVWTQIGADIITAGTIALADSTTELRIGNDLNSAARFWTGRINYAEVRNGIDGPIVAKFDPLNDATHGASSFTSATSEVWTVNGTTATIVGGKNGIKLAADESATDGYYNTNAVEITSGTGVGERRTITDYFGADKIAILDTALTTDATTAYRIENVTASSNEYGTPVTMWTPLAQVWSQVKPVRGSEYFSAQQMNARIDSVFRIRYRSDITTKMRINYGGEYYDIQGIIELGRREGLELMAVVHQA